MDSRRMTQKMKVLWWLKKYGSITPLDALREFGCMRLASRIAELKEAGWGITTEIESAKNTNGETVRFARYTLHTFELDRKREDQNRC